MAKKAIYNEEKGEEAMHDFLQLVVRMLQYGVWRALAAMAVCLLPLGAAYVVCR